MEPMALVTRCRALVKNAAAKPPPRPHMQTVWGRGQRDFLLFLLGLIPPLFLPI